MNDPGLVGELALELWQAREGSPSLRCIQPGEWSRRLAVAVAADVAGKPHYDPETDTRVRWVRAVLESRRNGSERPRASGDLEAGCAFLIGTLEACTGEPNREDPEVMFPASPRVVLPAGFRCGKDLAAGS